MKAKIAAQEEEKAQAKIVKIWDIQSLFPKIVFGYTKDASLLDHKTPKSVWYLGLREATVSFKERSFVCHLVT